MGVVKRVVLVQGAVLDTGGGGRLTGDVCSLALPMIRGWVGRCDVMGCTMVDEDGYVGLLVRDDTFLLVSSWYDIRGGSFQPCSRNHITTTSH